MVRGKDTSGFTLMEILIAIFILAVILSMLYAAYTGTFRNIDETQSRADMYEMARIALDRMVEDLECAYMSRNTEKEVSEEEQNPVTRFVGEQAETDGRRTDTLSFSSRAHLVFYPEDLDLDQTKITYEVGEGEDEGRFALFRSDTPELTLVSEEETRGGAVLCNGLHALRLIYYDENGEAYDSWDSTQDSFKDKLPARVSIFLEFVNPLDLEAPVGFFTSVALPMSGGDDEKGSEG
jgi:general secretion pathway protein J